MNELLRSVQRCLKRLERSDTQLKRHNARVAYRRASRALDREVDLAYRPLRDDGTEVAKVKRKGVACPYCRVPFKSMGQLVKHLQAAHGWSWSHANCICGKKCRDKRQLVKHLIGVGDLGVHLVKAALTPSPAN